MTLTVTDLFCGGGGSSTGAIQVPGVEIKIAANHWDLAVQVHNENHPGADHAAVDLHEEDPRYFPRTDILWASPECTKWSQASGGKYASVSVEADLLSLLDPELVDEDPETAIVQRSRLLMFDVLRFAEHHRYRAMVIENVVDIARNPKYAEAWALWKKGLANLGYDFRVVSLNSMHAQAHGDPAPQSRDRLYIVCWRKGDHAPDIDKVMRPLAWCPSCTEVVESRQAWKNGRTVGKYRSQYIYIHAACGTPVEPGYLPAAAAIDWTLRGTRIGDRAKPLADKTRRRIAAGIAKYWRPLTIEAAGNTYDAADPRHRSYGDPNAYYRAWSTHEALKSLHTTMSKALVVPLEGRAGDRVKAAGEVLRTQTARHQDAMVTPFIAELRGGGSDARPAADPLSTVTASGNHHALITRHYGIPGGDAARHTKPVDEAFRTMTANGGNMSLLTPAGGSWNDDARPASEPLRALTTRDAYGLVVPYYGTSKTAEPTGKPIGTLTTHDRYALIQRHNSSKGDGAEMLTPASEYLRTLTTKGHQSIITPGDVEAAEAMVDDCLFRMLEPHEVAAGMAFPADYIWQGTRRERVKLCGNAVTPPAARDLIAAVVEALGGAA
jgi:DNA (cytosine-5)-methyltransferase 1